MKRIFALVLMVCFSLLMVAKDKDKREAREYKDDKDHFRFTQEGESASLQQSNGFLSVFSLHVSRGFSTTAGSSASLQYSAVSEAADLSSLTITNLFGPIPSGAFTGDTTKHLELNIDTSALSPSTFSSETCTIDFTTFTQTCGPGPLGVIHLEWEENGLQRTIVDLRQTTFSGPVTTRLHQKSDNSTADVQGSVFGVPVSSSTGASATVGVNHQSTLEITRD